MNKAPPSLKNVEFNEDWTNHAFIEWLMANKKKLMWACIAFFAILAIVYQMAAIRSINNEKDYFQAQSAFLQFQQTGVTSPESAASATDFEKINAIMERHPEIKPRYQGPLAQTLLISQQIPKAEILSHQIFKRTQQENLQVYQSYSQGSLLINEGRYPEALKKTVDLKLELDKSKDFNPLLYTYSLLRLALLHQKLGQNEEELEIWQTLQNHPKLSESLATASGFFNVGQASLSQYIEERKKSLIMKHVLENVPLN